MEWFRHRFSWAGTMVAADKVDIFRLWPRPVKSFLLTLQFNAVHLATENGEKTYTKLADPLRGVVRRKEIHLNRSYGQEVRGAEKAT